MGLLLLIGGVGDTLFGVIVTLCALAAILAFSRDPSKEAEFDRMKIAGDERAAWVAHQFASVVLHLFFIVR